MANRRRGIPGGGIPFTPDVISGLTFWIKADSLGLSADALIASWTDLSGQGNHATQSVDAQKPVYKLNVMNGHATAHFDGVRRMTVPKPVLNGLSACTIWAVAKLDSADSSVLLGDYDTAGSLRQLLFRYNGVSLDLFFGGLGSDVVANGTTAITTTAANSLIATAPNGQPIKLYTNGTEQAYSTQNNAVSLENPVANTPSLGSFRNGSGSGGISGDIAELGVYNSVLSDANRELLVKYLRGRYATP